MEFKKIAILLLIMMLFSTNSFAEDATNETNLEQNSINVSTSEDNSSVSLNINSEAVILIENTTGKTLYEKNSEQKMYPASTTKILTAIIAIENSNLDDIATVSKTAISNIPSGYSSAYLVEGEQISIDNLLKELLIHSANDAANVIAEHVSGSIDTFVDLMNEKVQELGCANTHFVTTNGIHDENHYTTARDLSVIARYCMQNPTFRKYVSIQKCTIPATNKSKERTYKNTNDLINTSSTYYYPGCIGIKTGYTSEAKNCLISACNKNGLQLIAVVLGSGTVNGKSARYIDSKTLYDYGYANFSMKTIAQKSSVLKTITIPHATKETKNLDLLLEDNIVILSKNDSSTNISPEIFISDNLSAPISTNSVIGTATYTVDGTTYTSNIIASHDVIKNDNLYIILIISLIGFLLILIIIFIILKIHKKKKMKNIIIY